MLGNAHLTEFLFISFRRDGFFFSSCLPSYLRVQRVSTLDTACIQLIYILDTGKLRPLGLVDRRCVAISLNVVVLLPVGDDDDAAVERDNELLGEQHFQIVVAGADHAQNFARRHEAVVVGMHAEMEVQRLRAYRHVEKGIRVDDLRAEHSSLRHTSVGRHK